MKKLSVAAPVSQRERIIAEIMRLGCIEVDELPSAEAGELLDYGGVSQDAPETEALLAERTRLDAAIAAIDRYAPVKTPMFSPKPRVHEFALFNRAEIDRALDTAEQVLKLADSLEQAEAEQRRCEADSESLQPWLGLDVPMEFGGGRSFDYVAGTLPGHIKLAQVTEELAEAAPMSELWVVSQDKLKIYAALAAESSQREAAMRVLRKYSFAEQSFRFSGLAKERAKALSGEANAEHERSDGIKAELAVLSQSLGTMKQARDGLSNLIERQSVRPLLLKSKNVFFLQGWLPEKAVQTATAMLESNGCAYSISDPGKDDDVPVRLDNSRLVAPYNEITAMYGMPAYNSFIDPNPTMAFFYFLAFGIMLSDAAYGILLAAGCLFMLKKQKPTGSFKNMLTIFFYGGISTFMWGTIFGSYFGNAIETIASVAFGAEITVPRLIDPVGQPLTMMALSYVFGGIQIFTAMFLDSLRRIKRHDIAGAIFGIYAWYVLFAGIGLIFLAPSVGKYVAIGGAVGVMIGGALGKKGLGKIVGGFMALYNITGFLSDILSYSRLLALCLSTAVVANVVNILGSLSGFSVGGTILFILVFVAGHAINIALNLLGSYVHTSRLQYIEYFGRFYEGGGRAFKPLSFTTKYVEIIRED